MNSWVEAWVNWHSFRRKPALVLYSNCRLVTSPILLDVNISMHTHMQHTLAPRTHAHTHAHTAQFQQRDTMRNGTASFRYDDFIQVAMSI